MKYLYDADSTIDFFTDYPGARSNFALLLHDGIAISMVTLIELYTGTYGSREPEQANRQL